MMKRCQIWKKDTWYPCSNFMYLYWLYLYRAKLYQLGIKRYHLATLLLCCASVRGSLRVSRYEGMCVRLPLQ